MKAYIFKVHFYYSDNIVNYVVGARSEDHAELLLVDDLYRKYLRLAKFDFDLIGVCDCFHSNSNGESTELEEGNVIAL